MSRERELKLEIDPAAAEKLRSHPAFAGSPRVGRQISVYFDTPKGKLRRQGWTLRVRQHDEGWTQTIKRAGDSAGLFDREEWESPIMGLQPEFRAIEETPLRELVGARQFARLVPLFRSDVERTSWLIERGGAQIEASYDEGLIEAGDRSEPVHELELELTGGETGQLFAIARQIARRLPVRLGVRSKSERGFELATKQKSQSTKAPQVEIDPQASVADGFTLIVAACLKHFRLNEPRLVRDRDAEAMHQLRVAIRRLRTALWLFRPGIRDGGYQAINNKLRGLTRELGVARNIDVILSSMSEGDPARPHLERERERLYARILKMLDTRQFRLFMLELLAWTETGEWRGRKQAGIPLARFAARRLDKLWQVIGERASKLSALSVEERHQLRIDSKKMRYALEFLGGVGSLAVVARREFILAAEGIQDSLGHLNDLATRRAMLAWPIEDSKEEVGRCLRAARRHFRKMEKLGPFWRGADAQKSTDKVTLARRGKTRRSPPPPVTSQA
jgi:inorganic triphosphatase YgiF